MPVTESGIVLPSGAGVDPAKLRKAYRCNICGEEFPHGHLRSYEQHVAKCARDNLEEMRALSPKRQHPGIYGDGGVDTEYRDHIQGLPGGRNARR